MSRVGIFCNSDHEVLSEVSDILEAEAGVEVFFLDPGKKLPESELTDYDLLVPKKSRESVYRNLRVAESRGWKRSMGLLQA